MQIHITETIQSKTLIIGYILKEISIINLYLSTAKIYSTNKNLTL
jgi:hypothetical protein